MIDKKTDLSGRLILFIIPTLLLNIFFIGRLGVNLAYLTIFFQLVIFFLSQKIIRFRLDESRFLVLFLLFALFTIALFSSYLSPFPLQSLRLSLLIFLPSIFLVLLVYSDRCLILGFKKITKILMYIGVLLSIVSIILFTFGKISRIPDFTIQVLQVGPLNLYQIVMGTPPFYRMASLTTNPNTLGILLMLSLMCTIYLTKINLLSKRVFCLFFLIQFFVLLATQSRSAIITFFIMGIVFLLFDRFSVKNIFKISVFIVVLSMIYYIVLSLFKFDLLSRFQNGLSNRDIAWSIMLDRIMENPFLGVGFGVSSDVFFSEIGIRAHNIYLNVTTEIGIGGLLVFLLIWIIGILNAYRKAKNANYNKESKITYIFVFSILFSLLFHQIAENKLLVYDFVMFFWVYLIAFSVSESDLS